MPGSRLTDWRDATSYSRGERGTVEPRTWEIDADGMRVIVTRAHGLDGWWGTCHAMGVDRVECPDDLEKAKAWILCHLKQRAERWATKLAELLASEGGS